MQQHDIKRIGVLFGSYACNALVSQWVVGFSYLDILEALNLGCRAMILFVIPLWATGFILSNGHVSSDRRSSSSPILSTRNVVLFVHGVGVFMFVSIFCLLGLAITPIFWYTLGLAALAIDDSILGNRSGSYPFLKWVTVELAAMSLFVLVVLSKHSQLSLQEAIDRGDWMLISVGILLPIVFPVVPYFIRLRGGYTARQLVSYMQLGVPTLVLLASAVIMIIPLDSAFPHQEGSTRRLLWPPHHVSPNGSNVSYISTPAPFHVHQGNLSYSASNVRKTPLTVLNSSMFLPWVNSTVSATLVNSTVSALDGTWGISTVSVSVICLPFTLFPVVFFTFKAMLEYNTLDVMCVNSVVTAGKHMLLHPHCTVAGPAIILAAIALSLRLFSLAGSPTPVDRIPTIFYSEEAEYEDF